MGDKRIIERYRKKIQNLECDKEKLQSEVIALKKELSAANERYEAMSGQMGLSISEADRTREEMRNAIEEANRVRDEYEALVREALNMRSEYRKTMKKLIGGIERSSSVIDK